MMDPAAILKPHVQEGMTVLEPGPGMGFFTLELARRVGPSGRVVAVDIQPQMLASLKRRAARKGLLERIDARLATAQSFSIDDLEGTVDFVLAFAVVHELPDCAAFFRDTARALKPGATFLLAEPSGHVTFAEFDAELEAAAQCGLQPIDHPRIGRSRTALFRKVG
jgi:ubiquinone/menaquinone biosynthesis C-methylase UbiE